MLLLFDRLSVFLTKLLVKDREDKERLLSTYKIIYNVATNVFQLLSVVVIGFILEVGFEFLVLMLVYMVIRTFRKSIHFEDFYTCFNWSFSVFLVNIVCLSMINDYVYIWAIFLGLITALGLSIRSDSNAKQIY